MARRVPSGLKSTLPIPSGSAGDGTTVDRPRDVDDSYVGGPVADGESCAVAAPREELNGAGVTEARCHGPATTANVGTSRMATAPSRLTVANRVPSGESSPPGPGPTHLAA